MARRLARTAALQMVYENMLGGDGGEETLSGLIEFTPEEGDQEFIDQVLEGVQEHEEELDAVIVRYLKDWSLERIARVNRAVLRLAIYEMTYCKDVPSNVVISEAVGLAQKFDSPEGGKFVNGVLSSVLKDMNKEENA
ncbi:MAG: transcription antitermination factor NusB [Clostridiales bacterium]|nr:transcription antitermination factor NusB [Clostridiales bacterium]